MTESHPPSQFNLFPNTKPARGKYLGVISGLLRNIPPEQALDSKSEFTKNGAVHDAASSAAAANASPADGSSSGCDKMPDLLEDLCRDACEVFNEEAVVLSLRVDPDSTLVLVGDVHGQFRDLQLHVFGPQRGIAKEQENNNNNNNNNTNNNNPSSSNNNTNSSACSSRKDNVYLFLGDYVDRGPSGVEVITLLLALKVEYPNNVYMIRGNHEEAQVCRLYGFLHECKTKLTVDAWSLYNQVFTYLPLAAGVSVMGKDKGDGKDPTIGSFFCCHGGLNPHMRHIGELAFLQRQEYGQGMLNSDDSEIVDGLLWSDPAEHEGYRNNMRGCGYTFGKNCTKNFCETNGLAFICRAHQMVMEGYQWDHDGRLLTLFSAPNYCNINRNKGAIAVIRGDKQTGEKQQPSATPAASMAGNNWGGAELTTNLTASDLSTESTANTMNYNCSNIVIDFEVYTSAVDPCTLYYGVADGDPMTLLPEEVAPPKPAPKPDGYFKE